jgi:hypothetical protein
MIDRRRQAALSVYTKPGEMFSSALDALMKTL